MKFVLLLALASLVSCVDKTTTLKNFVEKQNIPSISGDFKTEINVLVQEKGQTQTLYLQDGVAYSSTQELKQSELYCSLKIVSINFHQEFYRKLIKVIQLHNQKYSISFFVEKPKSTGYDVTFYAEAPIPDSQGLRAGAIIKTNLNCFSGDQNVNDSVKVVEVESMIHFNFDRFLSYASFIPRF